MHDITLRVGVLAPSAISLLVIFDGILEHGHESDTHFILAHVSRGQVREDFDRNFRP